MQNSLQSCPGDITALQFLLFDHAPLPKGLCALHQTRPPIFRVQQLSHLRSQFKTVYTDIQKRTGGTPTHILLNGNWAMVQFSSLCNHRIRILPDRFLKWVKIKRALDDKDFDFALLHAEYFGERKHLTFLKFLGEELSTNWLSLIFTFIFGLIGFYALVNSPTGKDAIEKISETLLTATMLFLSVFILFTVSQNSEIIKDQYLFRKGLTHRFFRVDGFLTVLAVFSMLLCISVIMLLNVSSDIKLLGFTVNLLNVQHVIPLLSAMALTLLVDCFLSLLNYYFQRIRNVIETDLSK